jgi:hypothetical protein
VVISGIFIPISGNPRSELAVYQRKRLKPWHGRRILTLTKYWTGR